jgi:hypothetical protein
VHGVEITTYRYKGLLQEYVILCYGFPSKGPAYSAKHSSAKALLASCGSGIFTNYVTKYNTKSDVNPHSTEQDIQPIAFLISKQVVPYQTRHDTCCPGVSTPKIRSLAHSSTTCHDGINHLHHSNYCSNHSIDPHMVKLHLDGWKTTTLSQRYKSNSTSQWMKRLI